MPSSEQETNLSDNTHAVFRSRNFLESLGFALSGIRYIIAAEANFRTQLVIAGLVILAGVWFGVTVIEWLFLVFCIVLMLVLEIMNTVIERLCDLHTRGAYNGDVKFIKDIAAAACLITAGGSTVIGAIIFLPYLLKLMYALSDKIR